jgi:putative (di)nucleoside polyphosphate hydrolase
MPDQVRHDVHLVGPRMTDPGSLPYRPAAGIMLLNREGKVFVAQRRDSTLEAWQMPQGGLDPGEQPLAGALRELEEETGIAAAKVEIVHRLDRTLFYDLPPDLVGKLWKGRWRGQEQHWFLARFLGEDSDVNLDTAEPEFRAWRWAEPEELPAMIVPFKKQLYERVLAEFRDWL